MYLVCNLLSCLRKVNKNCIRYLDFRIVQISVSSSVLDSVSAAKATPN